MDRREVLKSVGAFTMAALASSAIADEHEHMNHEAHHHHNANPYAKLIAAASDCIEKGNLCISHCLELLGDGDKEMAACAKSVQQTLAICSALQKLASQQSSHLGELAKLAAITCKECEDECKKHADKHEECKNCMDACKACRKECEALSA